MPQQCHNGMGPKWPCQYVFFGHACVAALCLLHSQAWRSWLMGPSHFMLVVEAGWLLLSLMFKQDDPGAPALQVCRLHHGRKFHQFIDHNQSPSPTLNHMCTAARNTPVRSTPVGQHKKWFSHNICQCGLPFTQLPVILHSRRLQSLQCACWVLRCLPAVTVADSTPAAGPHF